MFNMDGVKRLISLAELDNPRWVGTMYLPEGELQTARIHYNNTQEVIDQMMRLVQSDELKVYRSHRQSILDRYDRIEKENKEQLANDKFIHSSGSVRSDSD